MRKPVHLPGTEPWPSYSPAMAAGDFVFISGQLGLNPETETLEEGAGAQAVRALESIAALLAVAGLSLADVVKTTVLVVRQEDGAAVVEACNRYLPEPRPARLMCTVAALARGALVEIDAIAFRGPTAG